ncbi:MAG: hypothetical protein K0R18_74 [Bacillales bacterium]|jgi:ketol-acid reductoisomerase|nr:hypothetical protein [Bacillales bacterium]
MKMRDIGINIEVKDEEPIFIVKEIVDNELRIRFIHNFEEAVEYSDRLIKLTPDMKLTVIFKGKFPDDFIEGEIV